MRWSQGGARMPLPRARPASCGVARAHASVGGCTGPCDASLPRAAGGCLCGRLEAARPPRQVGRLKHRRRCTGR
eukprot:scaffold349_cov352-Prasinococcus_capsulatus_cf.AAC.3